MGMRDLLLDVLDVDSLSEAERDALRGVLHASPEDARRAHEAWSVQQAVHAQVAPFVQEKTLLVAYALERAGRQDWLDAEERSLLDAHRNALRAALRAHPGLEAAIERTVQDARLIERCFITGSSARKPVSRGALSRRKMIFAGSGVVAALSALLLWVLLPTATALHEIRVETGTMQQVVLAGGHRVDVYGPAMLQFDLGANPVTKVQLSGRGVFDVASEGRGMEVETASGTIVVGGTSFGVLAQPSETEVYVLEGFVHVTPARLPDASLRVEAGFQTRLRPNVAPETPEPLDSSVLTWMDRFRFENTPLPDVARTLATYFETPVQVDAALQGESITGVFSGRDGLQAILTLIAETTGARVVALPDGGFLLARQP